jgi:yeast amino acid transporter
VKLGFLVAVIVIMGPINAGAGEGPKIGTEYWSRSVNVFDDAAANSWAAAFFMSLSIAAFAYIGIEIPAASALEARVPVRYKKGAVGRTVRWTAVWSSVISATLYVLAGLLVALNISWDNPSLPRMPWIPTTNNSSYTPDSAFVLVAQVSQIPHLAGTMSILLIFTALTCANTNLYVASRVLFSLTRSLDGGPNQPMYIRCLAYLGRTNHRKVPLRALIASCIFTWIPFLYLDPTNGSDTSIGTLLNVLSQMGSVGVVIVWACECWAFLRFYYW